MGENMHGRTADGRWSKGYFAWIEVIRVLPRWKWLVPILSVWPLTKMGPVFYRWLAKRRYTLFGVPPPCDASGVGQLHKEVMDASGSDRLCFLKEVCRREGPF